MGNDAQGAGVKAARAASLLSKLSGELTALVDNPNLSGYLQLLSDGDVRELCELLGACRLEPAARRLAREYRRLVDDLSNCVISVGATGLSAKNRKVLEKHYGPLVNPKGDPELNKLLLDAWGRSAVDLRNFLDGLSASLPVVPPRKHPSKQKRRGPAVVHDPKKDEKLLLDWKSAKGQGETRKGFCEGRAIRVKALADAQTRRRKLRQRTP